MNAPLVSVLMPVYNGAATLPMALASLLAQSYANWEAIIVDDGSTDGGGALVASVNDPRIVYVRLAQNQGRAAARQAALDYARGELIAKLDADDWIYPHKLAHQVKAMAELPEVALVSSGIAVIDAAERLVGVRARGPAWPEYVIHAPLRRPAPPPLAHAPSMLRASVAQRFRYDLALRRAEDADFLLQVVMAYPYCILHNVLYAYGEYRSTGKAEVLAAYHHRARMFRKWLRHYPVAAATQIGKATARRLIYQAAFAVGGEEWLVRQRSQSPSAEDTVQYAAARRAVLTMCAHRFGTDVAEQQIHINSSPVRSDTIQPHRQGVIGL